MAKFKVTTISGKSLYLDDKNEIHRGGEGRILLLPKENNKVAKIYHAGVKPLSEKRFYQLRKLDNELFVNPIELLYQNSQVVGFVMEYAGNDYFPLSSMYNRSFCQRNSITDKFKTSIAKQLIEALKQAHFNGFVIGDLNQFNVLVNLKGKIKLIDVDSYETPGHKHTGLMLEDIRDYYYQGEASMNGDYFALSVLLFYLLTYTHPFKGIHQKYKTLAERMIHQVPVFANDNLLKVPKCYEPVQNLAIRQKFEKMYLHGERFLFSLNGAKIVSPTKKQVLVAKYDEKELLIKPVVQNSAILDVYFGQKLGYVELKDRFLVYSAANKSYLTKTIELLKNQYDEVFIGNENILAKKGAQLFHVKIGGGIAIENFSFSKNAIYTQYENILIVVSKGQMYWLYLDEVLNHSIRTKRTEVFSEAIIHRNSLIQNTGGIHRIFYNTGNDIASVKIEKNIKQVFQHKNIGLAQFVKEKKIINQYFKVNGLKPEFVDYCPETFSEFAYMPASKNDGFIFEPQDNKLWVRRTEDFKLISELECSKVSQLSTLFYSNSGIIIWEGDEVFLANNLSST